MDQLLELLKHGSSKETFENVNRQLQPFYQYVKDGSWPLQPSSKLVRGRVIAGILSQVFCEGPTRVTVVSRSKVKSPHYNPEVGASGLRFQVGGLLSSRRHEAGAPLWEQYIVHDNEIIQDVADAFDESLGGKIHELFHQMISDEENKILFKKLGDKMGRRDARDGEIRDEDCFRCILVDSVNPVLLAYLQLSLISVSGQSLNRRFDPLIQLLWSCIPIDYEIMAHRWVVLAA